MSIFQWPRVLLSLPIPTLCSQDVEVARDKTFLVTNASSTVIPVTNSLMDQMRRSVKQMEHGQGKHHTAKVRLIEENLEGVQS